MSRESKSPIFGCASIPAFCWWILSLLLLSKSADATSVVVQLGPNRIVLAADTRGTKLNRGSTSVEDAECKIVPLGNAAFAVTGNEDYVPNQQNDQIASW